MHRNRPDKANAALKHGGLILLEPHLFESLELNTLSNNSWYSSPGGLFSPLPHLVLTEEFWDSDASTRTRRYYVVDAASAETIRFAQSMQAYTAVQYRELLERAGFTNVQFYPGVAPDRIPLDTDFCAIVAAKAG
jgi:hypothetical protein